MTASVDHVNQDLVVKLLPLNNPEGLPERDPAGQAIENIGLREFVLTPGVPVSFQRVVSGQLPEPGSGNLATFNEVVAPIHAEISTGPSVTSIWLMNFGSGTYVHRGKVRFNPPVSDHGTYFEKLPEFEKVIIDTGAVIRLGNMKTSGNGKTIWPAPVWQLSVEPHKPQMKAQWKDAADRPKPIAGDLRSRFARLGL